MPCVTESKEPLPRVPELWPLVGASLWRALTAPPQAVTWKQKQVWIEKLISLKYILNAMKQFMKHALWGHKLLLPSYWPCRVWNWERQAKPLISHPFSLLGCGVRLARVPHWSVGASGVKAFPKRTPDKWSCRTHISWDTVPRVLITFPPLFWAFHPNF